MTTWTQKKPAIIAALEDYGYTKNKTVDTWETPLKTGDRICIVDLRIQNMPGEPIPVYTIDKNNLDLPHGHQDPDGTIGATQQLIRTTINTIESEKIKPVSSAQPEKTKDSGTKPNTDDNTTVIVQTPKTDMEISGPSELTVGLIQSLINPLATVEEAKFFLELCKSQGLNPFIGEAYLIKYGSKAATYVVGKDAHLKRAEQQPSFDGFKAGIIVQTKNGELEEREGNFYISETDKLVGGWAEVHRKDIELYFISKVPLDEYVGRKKDGTVTKLWDTKPGTMIRKVALVQALREAFIGLLGGMYDISEIEDIGDVEVIE